MKKYTFLIAAIIAICFNVLPVYKLYGGQSTAYISDNFAQTVITPSGPTFAIWGIIFLMLIIVGLVNIRNPKLISDKALKYFIGSAVSISLWILAFGMQIPFAATILLFAILFFNIKVSENLPKNILHFYLIYTSWTVIASVVSFTILLQYDLGIKSIFSIPNSITALVVLAVGVVIYIFTARKFNSVTPLLVGAWAYYGISNVSTAVQPNIDIKNGAIIYMWIMLIAVLFIVYKNRYKFKEIKFIK